MFLVARVDLVGPKFQILNQNTGQKIVIKRVEFFLNETSFSLLSYGYTLDGLLLRNNFLCQNMALTRAIFQTTELYKTMFSLSHKYTTKYTK